MAKKKEMLLEEAGVAVPKTLPKISVAELPLDLQGHVMEWNERLREVPCGHKFYYAHVVGLTPLLMHRFTNETGRKRVYDPQQEAEKATYRNEEGILCVPNRNIVALLRDSVATYRWAKKQKELKELFMLSLFKVIPDMIPIQQSNGEFARTYEIYECGVIHSPKAGRVMEWRPMIRDWMLHFVVIMFCGMLPEEEIGSNLLGFLSQGGIHIGIGDFRGVVAKSGVFHYICGEFGRFKLQHLYEVEV